MTVIDLKALIDDAKWFSRIGTFAATDGTLAITSLQLGDVRDEWDWLPTTNDQQDPINTPTLQSIAALSGHGEQYSELSKELYALTLRSFRAVPDCVTGLYVKPSNCTPAAKGAALFAVRMAVTEIILGRQSFWCEAIQLYAEGFWPCGLTDDRKLVVY